MKVYIVANNPCVLVGAEDLKIITVKSEQEEAFQKEYAGRIVAEGSSIQEVIIQFSQLVNG